MWVTIDETSHIKQFPKSGVPPEVKMVLYYIPLAEHLATLVRRYVSNQLRGSNANSVLQYRIEAEDREIQASLEGRKADIFSSLSYYIDDVLSSTEVVEQLKMVEFDLIVGDVVQQLQVFLSQTLKVPFVEIGLTYAAPSKHDHFAHNPSNPAYVPERLSFLSDTLTFRERLKNTLLYWLTGYFYYKYMLSPLDEVLRKHNLSPDAKIGQLIPVAELWIFNSDFVVDFPRPLSPHVKFVGGILTGHALPLSEVKLNSINS